MSRSSGERARRVRAWIALTLALAACLATGALAAAPGDDRASTEAVLAEIERSPRKDVAGELVARSRAAQGRAAKLRASGDEAHARLADAVGRRWADAARDVTRAAMVEQSAAAARLAATDAGALADRERALLEEAIAQSGRLRAQIEAAERSAKEQPARTSAAANARPAAAKPAPKDSGASGAAAPSAADGGAR